MKNIETIISEAGLEVTEEQLATINKAVAENYKTVNDYNKQVEKRDEYKTSLDEVQSKLDGFKDVDVDNLQEQIKNLAGELQSEKDARAEDARKVGLEKSIEAFLADKEFVNPITAKSIRTELATELDKDTAKGKSISDIFNGLISDEDGEPIANILVDEGQKRAQDNKAQFTTPVGKKPAPGTKYSASELMKLKNENPDMDITQYM